MEPIAYNLLLGSDSFIAGSSFGLEQDFGFCMSSQDFQRNKSKSVRSRLSSFADWNRGPTLQTLLQQFGAQANSTSIAPESCYYQNLHHQAFFGSSSNNNADCSASNLNHVSSGGNKQENLVLSRQCFLFNDYLLLCVRTKDGKLQLLEVSKRSRISQ